MKKWEKEFENSTNDDEDWKNHIQRINESKELLKATWRSEENKVAEMIE